MNEIEIAINVPPLEELLKRTPQVKLRVRSSRDDNPPFTKEALSQTKDYYNKPGIYIHLWEKTNKNTVVRYVGQTGVSFRNRLNSELTLVNGQCSKYFIDNLKNHVGKKDLSTIFFDDEEIAKMVIASQEVKKNTGALRFLVEQAMTIAYSSEDMLNVHRL